MKRLAWSKWFNLGDLNRACLPGSPGVYQIRWAIKGKPQPISRANGINISGTLYIGKSVDLEQRIKRFCRGIVRGTEGRATPDIHTAAYTYTYYGFDKKFEPTNLDCRYAKLPGSEISKWEENLLTRYVRAFLDKPPLNISVKRLR